MSDKRILIFDLDGTLLDTMGPLADLFCDMLRSECGVPDDASRPIYHELAGKGPRPQFEAVLSPLGLADAVFLDDITERYWQVAESYEAVPFPETLEALGQLRRDGHTLIVSSGGTTASVRRKMRVTGVDRLIRLALGTDLEVPGMAKGPGHFELVKHSLSFSESELLAEGIFIGDAVYDMQVAREAGIVGVGRVTGDNGPVLQQAGARHLIQDLREMRPLIASL
jgi:phosphoglycolate phosphatase-like HAD superfamily hydrolase